MSAIPWATPSASASPDDRSSARRVPRPRRSATSIATPTTARVTTITFGVRSVSSSPERKRPIGMSGIVPTPTSHASFAGSSAARLKMRGTAASICSRSLRK